MNTVTIEILRLGTQYNYNVSNDLKYIAICGTHPPVEFSIVADQRTVNRHAKCLRYKTDETSRLAAIQYFQTLLTDVFDKIVSLRVEGNRNEEKLHLRMVMTPKELVQLPFELVLTPKGFKGEHSLEFLLNSEKATTLTREIRQVNSPAYQWPFYPRILFVWAEPKEKVPKSRHLDVLVEILQNLAAPINDSDEAVPNLEPLLTVVGNASLGKIKAAINDAFLENRPFTHVHILAHGVKIEEDEYEYKIALTSDDDVKRHYYASGEELVDALTIAGQRNTCPAIITLMTCDSSNGGSTLLPTGSLAYELHEYGIPCVFASQFPLTEEGSINLVKSLYDELLLHARDPREALYLVRESLKGNERHDWASLVAYVRFPEDIDKQLQEARLKLFFASMKTANKWTEYVFRKRTLIKEDKIVIIYEDVRLRLESSIQRLSEYLNDGKSSLSTNELRAEHFGLLGSAFKRKSEHLFRMAGLLEESKDSLMTISLDSLERAQEFYKSGFDILSSSHWNAMQYLSLKAVITGSIQDEYTTWTIIKFMAEKSYNDSAENSNEKLWAAGTLMELYLLKPLTISGESAPAESKVSLQIARTHFREILDSNVSDIIESTILQLERYISWWPEMHLQSYDKGLKDLASDLMSETIIP